MIERRRMLMGTKIVDDSDYLTFTALEDGTFTLTIPASVNSTYLTSVAYSIDDGATWVTSIITSYKNVITTPTVAAGSTVKWKGIGTAYASGVSTGSYSSFSSTGRFSVSGNIMSLLFGDNYRGKKEISSRYVFSNLFYNCNKITDASNLLLPATKLVYGCYWRTFYGCTSLTTAPALLAAKLDSYCYYQMFYGCTNLNSVTCLATDLSISTGTDYWLSNVSANGTFTKAAGVSWRSGASGIPSGWTVQTA